MQTSLLAGVQPVCTARGKDLSGRCKESGFSALLAERRQKGAAQTAGCRQHCVYTRAAKQSSRLDKSASAFPEEDSAPSLAAASQHSHGQADRQTDMQLQEGMLNNSTACVFLHLLTIHCQCLIKR